MLKKTIGRSDDCDYVIIDPQNRVSRQHVELLFNNGVILIKDLGSLNGTYVNGKKLNAGMSVQVKMNDLITLSKDYPINLSEILDSGDPDQTRVLPGQSDPGKNSSARVRFIQGDRTIVFEQDHTKFEDLARMEQSGFISIGRSNENRVVINKSTVSKQHCQVRLLTPVLIEIEDLGSTNGTFADGERLPSNTRLQYASSVKVRLGQDTVLDLRKIFPGIQIIEIPTKTGLTTGKPVGPESPKEITKHEKAAFDDLETVWKEYVERQNKIASSGFSFMAGGSVLGAVGASMLGGPMGIALGIGGGLLGRYLAQQESSKLKGDTTYDDMFLQVYACPRCKESFQKKPWITIRDCFKCKLKFR